MDLHFFKDNPYREFIYIICETTCLDYYYFFFLKNHVKCILKHKDLSYFGVIFAPLLDLKCVFNLIFYLLQPRICPLILAWKTIQHLFVCINTLYLRKCSSNPVSSAEKMSTNFSRHCRLLLFIKAPALKVCGTWSLKGQRQPF